MVHTCEAITRAAERQKASNLKRKVRFPNDLYTPKIIIIVEENSTVAAAAAAEPVAFVLPARLSYEIACLAKKKRVVVRHYNEIKL